MNANTSREVAATPGAISGSTTCRNRCQAPAPSVRAAVSSSSTPAESVASTTMPTNAVSFHTYSAMIATPNPSAVSAGKSAGASVVPAAYATRESRPLWESSSSMASAPTRCGTGRVDASTAVTSRRAVRSRWMSSAAATPRTVASTVETTATRNVRATEARTAGSAQIDW